MLITLLYRPPLILVILDWSYITHIAAISTAYIDHLGIVIFRLWRDLEFFSPLQKEKLKERRQRREQAGFELTTV